MAQRDYGQFFDSAHAGQTDEDDWRLAAPLHPLLLSCQFTIYWICPEATPIAGSDARTIISIGTTAFDWFRLVFNVADDEILLFAPGVGTISQAITFDAYSEIRFDVDGVAGTLTISGALTGNGTYSTDPWADNVDPDAICRIGGIFTADGSSAKGWVSLPYARVTTGIGVSGGEGDGFFFTDETGELTGIGL